MFWRSAVTVTWADFVCARWRRGGSCSGRRKKKTLVKDFFVLSMVMVFKTGCILVTVEMKMYIHVHMPSDFSFFLSFFVSFFSFLFVFLLRPVPVCSLLRLLLAIVVMREKKKRKKNTKMCDNKSWRCSIKNQLSLCCVQHGLCLNVSFYFWGTSAKKVNNTVRHCCTVSVELWILCLVS